MEIVQKMKGLMLIFVLLLLSSCSNKPDAYDAEGHPIQLSSYQGKWVFINYWATWCQPCLKELPELNAFYQSQSNKVVVIGVSFDGLPNAEILKLAQKLNLTFPLLSSFPSEKYGIPQISTLPATVVISPQGKLIKTIYGPQTQQTLMAMLKIN